MREGNLVCTDVQPEDVEWNELKFGDLRRQLGDLGRGEERQLTQKDDDGPLEVTLTAKVGSWDEQTFDWVSDSDTPVSAVIVKGITGKRMASFVNVYEYDEPVTSDTGLHAPIDVNRSMEPFDLKKVRFCYEDEDDTTTTTVEEETTTTTVEESTTTTVEETTTTTVEESTTTTAPPDEAAPPPAPPAQPVTAQPNFVG